MVIAAFMSEGLSSMVAGLGPYDGAVAYVDDVGATTFAPRCEVVDNAVDLGQRLSEALGELGLRINRSNTAVIGDWRPARHFCGAACSPGATSAATTRI